MNTFSTWDDAVYPQTLFQSTPLPVFTMGANNSEAERIGDICAHIGVFETEQWDILQLWEERGAWGRNVLDLSVQPKSRGWITVSADTE